ncbi:hypothetical protein NST81_09340 [Bacillus sp. FSL W8-0223]|uniref:hypothetical protein n=1 Tax=Bacillus sp. FSL W8-0223 TaxID=2954595 RepID=UPI0030F530FD
MTESSQSNVSIENNIFINDLIEITRKNNKELKKFIDYHLFPKKSPLSFEAINNNIKALERMDKTQRSIVKARAKEFEESYDPSKHFPPLFGIFGFLISMYSLLKEINRMVGIISSIMLIVGITTYSAMVYTKAIQLRSTAVFFNALINSLKYDEK